MRNTIYIYADFDFISDEPKLIGRLDAESISGRGDRFRFAFDGEWITRYPDLIIDPSLSASDAVFTDKIDIPFLVDAMPDRWGRTLIIRREAKTAEKENRKPRICNETDFLLGIDDASRKGGIRFANEAGQFLSKNPIAIPPISKLGDYLEMIADYEKHGVECSWLDDFFSPSSSLGGARPKINMMDNDGNLWIAKVPSKDDEYDIGEWEQVAMELAAKAGIDVPETRTLSYGDGFHTFLSKRFDRDKQKRIHIASALCLLGWKNSDDASFIDIAELISQYSVSANKDLQELYRRIVFSALINNTDNHLRNHSFLLAPNGWKLSPAYDMNPSIHGRTSVLAIDEGIHAFSMEAIKETAVFYNLSDKQAKDIIEEVQDAVSGWERCARQHGLSKEIPLLRSAFAL